MHQVKHLLLAPKQCPCWSPLTQRIWVLGNLIAGCFAFLPVHLGSFGKKPEAKCRQNPNTSFSQASPPIPTVHPFSCPSTPSLKPPPPPPSSTLLFVFLLHVPSHSPAQEQPATLYESPLPSPFQRSPAPPPLPTLLPPTALLLPPLPLQRTPKAPPSDLHWLFGVYPVACHLTA